MSPRGAYIPLHQFPTPSLASSRLFNTGSEAPQPSVLKRVPPRPSLRSLVVLFGTAAVLFVLLYPKRRLTWLEEALQGEGLDYRLEFNQLYLAAKAGWRPYEPSLAEASNDSHDDEEFRLGTWVDKLGDECVEQLVARGEVCLEGWPREPAQVDAVWTWTNGTDPLLQVWRAEVTAVLAGKVSPGVSQVRAAKRARHFRDHDELRYSIRSVLSSFPQSILRKLHILSTDLPSQTLPRDSIRESHEEEGNEAKPAPLLRSSRLGQIPGWLAHHAETSRPPLAITHHSSFFSNLTNLPTFNSLSIESQLPYLSSLESEFLLYLNDDTFLLGRDSLVETDVGSPLIGQVFRLQDDLTVGSTSPDDQVLDREGEWSSLERANWLLDRRFGSRPRHYLAHIPKTMSMPILREIGIIWKDELEKTASSRFRGRGIEYQLPFLATHYTIESHRQALLLAFIVGRIDRNSDGVLSVDERIELLNTLGFRKDARGRYGGDSSVLVPVRSSRQNLPSLLVQANLGTPRSTTVHCTSMDGYCAFKGEGNAPPVHYEPSSPEVPLCAINLLSCFGDEFLEAPALSTFEIFKGVSFLRPACGDCMIARLVSTSGSSGLSSFLPENPKLNTNASSREGPFNLRTSGSGSIAKTFGDFAMPSSSAMSYAREILRYSYVLGHSKSKFYGLKTPGETNRLLKEAFDTDIESSRNLTFLTLNDDFPNDHVSEMTRPILDHFFETTWPLASPYEV